MNCTACQQKFIILKLKKWYLTIIITKFYLKCHETVLMWETSFSMPMASSWTGLATTCTHKCKTNSYVCLRLMLMTTNVACTFCSVPTLLLLLLSIHKQQYYEWIKIRMRTLNFQFVALLVAFQPLKLALHCLQMIWWEEAHHSPQHPSRFLSSGICLSDWCRPSTPEHNTVVIEL